MRRIGPVLVLAALTAAAGPAFAEICSVDQKPAATLLVPYFEVSLAAPGVNTLLSIHNTEATPVTAHLTAWTDVGIPAFDFYFGLGRFDVYTLDLRAMLTTGSVPASAPMAPASCDAFVVRQIQPDLLERIRKSLTGQPIPVLNLCDGLSLPDRPDNAHGFITIDVVRDCQSLFPGDVGYFKPGGTGVASNRNALWGTTFFVDNGASLAHAMPMVHIEASAAKPETASQPNPSKPRNYTFYARLVGWNGADNREPLATSFGIRFYTVPPFGATELFVWRDSKHRPEAFACPPPRPPEANLGQKKIVAFNEDSAAYTFPPKRTLPFQVMAQRVKVNGPTLVIPAALGGFGWLFLNLNHSNGSAEVPALYTDIAQAWVFGVANTATPPIFTGAFDAMPYDSACRGKTRFPRIP